MTRGRIIVYSVLVGVVACVGVLYYFKPTLFTFIVPGTSTLSRGNSLSTSTPTSAENGADSSSAVASSTPNSQPIVQSDAVTAAQVIILTNAERAENGNVPPLTENADLDAAAETKVNDMFAKQYFEHVSPNGTGPGILAEQAGYEYILEGENLALGDFKDTQALLDAWMASPGHRANILNVRYTNIGAAVGEGIFDGKETWLAVQEFGLPLSSCPSIDAGLHSAILSNETQSNDLTKNLTTLKSALADISTSTPAGMTSYDQNVTHYNADVALYDGVSTRLQAEIQTYNAQVQAFNACVDE